MCSEGSTGGSSSSSSSSSDGVGGQSGGSPPVLIPEGGGFSHNAVVRSSGRAPCRAADQTGRGREGVSGKVSKQGGGGLPQVTPRVWALSGGRGAGRVVVVVEDLEVEQRRSLELVCVVVVPGP